MGRCSVDTGCYLGPQVRSALRIDHRSVHIACFRVIASQTRPRKQVQQKTFPFFMEYPNFSFLRFLWGHHKIYTRRIQHCGHLSLMEMNIFLSFIFKNKLINPYWHKRTLQEQWSNIILQNRDYTEQYAT